MFEILLLRTEALLDGLFADAFFCSATANRHRHRSVGRVDSLSTDA